MYVWIHHIRQMVKGQEYPVEVYYAMVGNMMNEVKVVGFENLEKAVEIIPDLLTNKNWINVGEDSTRFESIAVYNWLRDIKK